MSAATASASNSPPRVTASVVVDSDEEHDTPIVPPSPLQLPGSDNEGNDGTNNSNDGTLYKYRDFSNVPEDHDAGPEEPTSGNGRSLESSIRVQKFPVKLYAILAQKEFADIVSWMPHGRSWKVLKPNLFESLVMPLFFEYSNYHSFNRLVNAWSFRRISSGHDRGSYYHEVSYQRERENKECVLHPSQPISSDAASRDMITCRCCVS